MGTFTVAGAGRRTDGTGRTSAPATEATPATAAEAEVEVEERAVRAAPETCAARTVPRIGWGATPSTAAAPAGPAADAGSAAVEPAVSTAPAKDAEASTRANACRGYRDI
ncbi:hypothetical protein GCM10010486_69040 [Nonomuraea roseoviolacea subsp. carminata]